MTLPLRGAGLYLFKDTSCRDYLRVCGIDSHALPETLEIYTDGASRGNPGPAAYAFIFVRHGAVMFEESSFIGTATNNTAEYSAIVAAVRRAKESANTSVVVYSDSELVVRQINGQYRTPPGCRPAASSPGTPLNPEPFIRMLP
jgi:hypothetical protein